MGLSITTFSYAEIITWHLFSHVEWKSDKVMTCWEILAWEFYNVRAFAVRHFWQIRLVLYCLLLIKSSATDLKCFWPFNSKKLPSVKPKIKSAIGVDWISVCLVSKYTDICLLISCLNTGFRIADKECHGNCVVFKRATLETSSKEAGGVKHNKTTGLPG